MGSPIVSSAFQRLLYDGLREVGERTLTETKSMIPMLYNMMTSKKAWEEFFEVGAVPDIPEFQGKLTTLSVHPGFYVKVEHKEFGAKLEFERKFLDDKRYGALGANATGLMESAMRVKEKYGVRPFGNAFSTAFDFMTHEENVALCSSSHTTKSGTSTSSGFDNAGTTAISPTAVSATRILMKQFRNDISERIDISDDLALIVPDNLSDRADEIVGTKLGLDTTEGNMNPQYKRYTVIPYARLDDYDTNNWFMVDMKSMKRNLVWFDRIMPEINTNIDFNTFSTSVSVYFRCSYGWRDWRFIYGHAVS